MHRRAAMIAVTTLVIASVAFASVTVTGSVVDETGNPVAGARVSTDAAAATTDAAGEFRFDIPDAGEYQLRVQREGYFLFLNKSVHFDPASPFEIHLVHLKELSESIDVPYSPPVVDPDQTTEVKRLDGQAILNLPYAAAQDYRRALTLMPGAMQDNSGQVHFNGGSTNETSYRLDGFDLSDPATGGLGARLSVDTIQSVEWSAGRMTPDNKGSAGTVDIKTEMGDDRWRFGATNPIPSFDTSGGLHLNHWSPRLMTSGPIKKGKAWFHTALDPFYTADTVSSLPKGQNRTSSFNGSDLSRFQWNVSDWQTLTASFLYNRGNIWRDGLSVLNPIETTVNQRSTLLAGTIKDQFIVSGNLVEAGFATTENYMQSSPRGDAPYLITPFGSSGNFFRNETTNSSRQEGIVNAAFRPLRWRGTHQIRIGTDIESSNLAQTIMRHDLSVVRTDGSVVRTVQFEGAPQQATGNLEAYGYFADHWSPAATVTLDIGLRTQWNRITGSAPPAPRLAAAWAPKKLGGAKLSAGWGVYYDPITLSLMALNQEQTSLTTYYAPNGAALGPPMETIYVVDTHNMRSPRFTLASASAEKALPWGFFGRVDLTSRRGSRLFALDQLAPTPVLNEYISNNSGHASYRAAEVALRRTFHAKYQWYGSYTRSSAHSDSVIAYTIENPLLTAQAGGPQPWDTPNRFLMWGWMPVAKTWFPRLLQPVVGDTDFQLLADYHTGLPFNATTETGYLAGAPDSRRFPDYFSVNIALERQFHFHGYLWAWRAGIVNVLDRANPNVVNADANSPQFLLFGRGQARAVNVRLRFLGKK